MSHSNLHIHSFYRDFVVNAVFRLKLTRWVLMVKLTHPRRLTLAMRTSLKSVAMVVTKSLQMQYPLGLLLVSLRCP